MVAATSTQSREEPPPWVGFLDRLETLRRRLLWSLLGVVAGTLICWAFREPLFDLLARPVTNALVERGEDPRLAFTGLTDPFIVYLSVSMLGGALLGTPLLAAQLWWTLVPSERRALTTVAFMLAAAVLFAAGVAFGHQILLPFVVGYLIDVAVRMRQVVTAREYMSFVLRLLLALGVTAELPLISMALARIGVVTARRMWRWFPYAVLVAFVLAALITPPDGISQVMVAVPVIALYLLSIAVAAVAARRP